MSTNRGKVNRNNNSSSRSLGGKSGGVGGARGLASPREVPDLEHAQILSELMTGGANPLTLEEASSRTGIQDLASILSRERKSSQPLHIDSNQQQKSWSKNSPGQNLMMDYKPSGMGLPAGEHIPDLLSAINRLNDTVELLRCEVTDLRSQISNQKMLENSKDTVSDLDGVMSGQDGASGGVEVMLDEEVDFTGGLQMPSSQGLLNDGPPAKKQFKLVPINDNLQNSGSGIVKVPMGRNLLQAKVLSVGNSIISDSSGLNGKFNSGDIGIGLDGDLTDDLGADGRKRGFTVNNASDDDESEEEEYDLSFGGVRPGGGGKNSGGGSSIIDSDMIGALSPAQKREMNRLGTHRSSDSENMYAGRSLRSKVSPSKTRST